MANIILKLIPNKWDEKHFFSFIKKGLRCPKDQHFLAHNNFKKEIVAGEHWECFIWSKRELEDKILFKVVPYQKIDSAKLKEERQRVFRFNRELSHVEKFISDDFEKIVFKTNNMPFLKSKGKTKEELAQKYPDFTFLDDPEGVLARPPAPKPFFKKPFKKKFNGPRPPFVPRGQAGAPPPGYRPPSPYSSRQPGVPPLRQPAPPPPKQPAQPLPSFKHLKRFKSL